MKKLTINSVFRAVAMCFVLLLATRAGAQVIAQNDLFSVLERTCSNYLNVTANDNLNGFNIGQLQVLTQPVNGTASVNGNYITYCPFQGYVGADHFKYTVTAGGSTDSATVFINVEPFNSLVFPGDADQNGKVENFDVLTIGLAYDLTGPARPDPSSRNALAWSPSNLINSDPGAADCNGDGIVDSADMAQVAMYYGQVAPSGIQYDVDTSTCGNDLPFFVEAISGDTIANGDTLRVAIKLGQSNTVNDAYGIAFSLDYDTGFIPRGSISFSTSSSWLMPNGQGLFFQHEVGSAGRIDIAVTNTTKQDLHGGGQVLYGIIPIDDNICGIMHSPGWYNLLLSLRATRLINQYNQVQSLCVQQAGIRVYKNATAVKDVVTGNMQVYPNPANDRIFIKADKMEQVEVTDLAGRRVYIAVFEGVNQVTIDLKSTGIEAGAYLLHIKTISGMGVKKIIVQQ